MSLWMAKPRSSDSCTWWVRLVEASKTTGWLSSTISLPGLPIQTAMYCQRRYGGWWPCPIAQHVLSVLPAIREAIAQQIEAEAGSLVDDQYAFSFDLARGILIGHRVGLLDAAQFVRAASPAPQDESEGGA